MTLSRVSRIAGDRLNLFAHLDDICYFVKDRDRRFIAINQALVQVLCLHRAEQLLGEIKHEHTPSDLSDAYEKDDFTVLNSGVSIVNKVELITHNDLSVVWHITTKVPLRDESGEIVGMEGTIREFTPASSAIGPYPGFDRLIDYVRRNYAEKFSVTNMAKITGLTVRTFERRFRERFAMSPIAYLRKVRINMTCRELIHTNRLLADIALSCGFCDQSYMTKEFTRIMRTTPQAYRSTHNGARNYTVA